ncbi:hypothetical protein F4779DRAFT_617338 [Xylariaceae sp. FL0662B]|nr:hypothetical protein F4779DRAFT_617338 [Xylariaceae sp. FL0662B]
MPPDPWEPYFLGRSSAAASYVESLREQIDDLGDSVFSPRTLDLAIIDITKEKREHIFVTNEDEFDDAVRRTPAVGTRIISIHSRRTIAPLKITSALAAKMLRVYAVNEGFLRILLSFGDEPHQSEASSSNKTYVASGDGNFVLTYKLNYVEQNKRDGQNPWSFRHVGVYHHHMRDKDLIILVHCSATSSLSLKLSQMLDKGANGTGSDMFLRTLSYDPSTIHSVNNSAMVETTEGISQASFLRVQELRNAIDFAMFANASCMSNLDVVDCLAKVPSSDGESTRDLSSMGAILQGFVDSSKVLQDRIRNSIDLIGYTLTIHNQQELQNLAQETGEVTRKLKELTENTVDDSAIVRIITIVSAFYLPGSFVATIFGMNFFDFDEARRRIMIASDFWIFVVIWAVLTLITVGVFYLTYLRNSRGKGPRAGLPRPREKV